MQRQKRVKLIRQALEAKLAKYETRIQKMAENAYKIRQFLETLNREVQDDAIRDTGSEGSISSGSTDRDAGESNLPDSAVVTPVLEEQPAELQSDSGNIGINSGSTV